MQEYKKTIIILAAAFCLGLGLSYLWYTPTDEQQKEEAMLQERVSSPEKGGVKSSAFGLQLLRTTMDVQPEGNIVVAPDSMAALLNRLREFADGPAKTALDALKLPKVPAQTAIRPSEVALIFPDSALQLAPDVPTGRDIYPTPFSSDLSAAHVTLDKALSFYSEQELNDVTLSGLIQPAPGKAPTAAGAKASNPDVRLVAVNGISFHEPWMQLPNTADTCNGTFTNSDGTGSVVDMVKHKGRYRVVQDPDGEWEAVAIFFRNEEKTGDSACFVAILPKGYRARTFVERGLTLEKLNTIRQALLQTPPEGCTVEIPKLDFPNISQDMTPVLKAMGLESLFTDPRPLPKLVKSDKTPLTMAIQQHRITLKENQDAENDEPAPSAAYPTAIRLDRPFIWYIGDLSSDQPPYLMGIIERL